MIGCTAGGSLEAKTVASSTTELGVSVLDSEPVWGSMKDAKAESAAEDVCGALFATLGAAGSDDAKKADSEADDVCAELLGSVSVTGSIDDEKAVSPDVGAPPFTTGAGAASDSGALEGGASGAVGDEGAGAAVAPPELAVLCP